MSGMAALRLWRGVEARVGAGQRAILIASAGFVVCTLIALHPVCLAAEESSVRLFAAHALSLRAAGLMGDEAAKKVLGDMPGVRTAGEADSLPVLWSPFFENVIVKIGRLRSAAPVALYYNPLLDVAVFTLWERRDDGYRVASVRALPGERLARPDADAPLRPSWTVAAVAVEALARTAAARLEAFRRRHPAASHEAGRDAVTFAAAAADMRAALPRLVWNMAMRVQWAEGGSGWLGPVLARIDAALAARDPAVIVAAAPDTDAVTADALTRLPSAFAEGFTLDMTLEAGGNDRLVVASTPGDGHVYTLALCRLDGGVCRLRRFLLMSLVE